MYARSVSPAEKRYKNQRRLGCNPSRKATRSCVESTQQEDLTLHGGQEGTKTSGSGLERLGRMQGPLSVYEVAVVRP